MALPAQAALLRTGVVVDFGYPGRIDKFQGSFLGHNEKHHRDLKVFILI